MGQFDRLRRQLKSFDQIATPQGAGPEAEADAVEPPERLDIARPVQLLFAIGIDGQGPLTSAVELADAARASGQSTEEAVARVARTTIIGGAAGGFITGATAHWARPVALPVNVVEFYVQAARMVGAIATLRGHDVSDGDVRRAVLHTLTRAQSDSPLVKAISGVRGGMLTRRMLVLLPSGALLMVNKGIGFRILSALVERLFGRRLSRGVPFIGGIVIAVRDTWILRRIAERAKVDFPVQDSVTPGH